MFHYATVRSKSRANKINALRPLVHSPFRSNCSSWAMQRLGVEHELAPLAAFVGGGDRDLAAELIR